MNLSQFKTLQFIKIGVSGVGKQQAKSSKCHLVPATWLKALFPIFLVLTSLFTSPLVEAQDFIFQPRVVTGAMRYKYEVSTEGSSIIKDRIKLDEILPFLGVGATLVFPTKTFMSVYFQTTTTKDIKEDGTFTVGTSDNPSTLSFTRDTEIERQDFSISAGHKITDNLSFFLGYKRGDTKYDWTDREQDDEGNSVGIALKENDFSADGGFVGAAYNLRIGGGVLGLRFAAAKLNGEITTSRIHKPDSDSESDFALVERTRKEQISSETIGFKIGINWNASITKRLSYGISLDGFQYSFEPESGAFTDSVFSDNRGHQILDLEPYEVEETVYSFSLLLRYRF